MACVSMLIKVCALSLLGLQVAAVPYRALLNQTILPRHLEAPDLIEPDLFDAQYCFESTNHESHEHYVLWASREFCTKEIINHQEETIPARPLEAFHTMEEDLYFISLLGTISSFFGSLL